MMKIIVSVVVVLFIGYASSQYLPQYLPKCKFSDPNLSKCIKEKANLAIPLLVRGDRLLGIPQLSPLRTLEVILVNETDFNLTITNLHFDNLKDFRIDDMYFEPNARSVEAEFMVKIINITADYELINGVIDGTVLNGSGILNMTFVNNRIYYSTLLDHYTRHDKVYAKTKNSAVTLNSERASFHFSGLETFDISAPSTSNPLMDSINNLNINETSGVVQQFPLNDNFIQDFINENWREVYARLKPTMEALIMKYFHAVIDSLHQKVAIKDFFD